LRKQFRARARPVTARLVPLVASLLGLASIGLFYRPSGFGEHDFVPLKNALTISLFAVPCAFALASVAALAFTVRSIARREPSSRVVQVHSLLVALGACALVSWMASCGWIGVRIWSY
jgi:hypothetical protein